MKINWKKCNWLMTDDGLLFCEGLHDKSVDCEWQQLSKEHIESIIEKL